jgi:hypothetical protein
MSSTNGWCPRSWEAWLFRQCFRRNDRGGDNALLVRLGHHVFVYPNWPTHRGARAHDRYHEYITESGYPDWVHETFDPARRTY